MQPFYTEQQELLRSTVAEFAANEVAPYAVEVDSEEKFPKRQMEGLGELGLLGLSIAEEAGGAGLRWLQRRWDLLVHDGSPDA